jgi:hypothetical protein
MSYSRRCILLLAHVRRFKHFVVVVIVVVVSGVAVDVNAEIALFVGAESALAVVARYVFSETTCH